jgi:hypothetical protein
MKHYSIVRDGNDYIVRSDASSILRVASRRLAARLIADASELLASSDTSAPEISMQASIVRDPLEVS